MRVLNVDDNEPSRNSKSRILAQAGFEVFETTKGAAVLEKISEHQPDLILLDVNLPDMHGFDVCRQVKSRPELASIMVLQISAYATSAPQTSAALDSGADAYLTEPVDPEVLVATVKALLRLRRAERDLRAANAKLVTLNQELRRSNEDLEQFAFAASHDLQEPLRTIASFVGLLERTVRSKLSGAELEYLGYIADGSRRMRVLIEDLLRFSQIGHRPESHRLVDLNAVMEWVVDNLHEGISASRANISVGQLPQVMGDEQHLGLVFQNLISNAIKYARPDVDPMIEVSARRAEDKWLIEVKDNGIGIADAYYQLVFGAFKRLHGREIPGTGIGLAVCRRVVEAHSGHIWVDSKPGEGSTFRFTLSARNST